MQLTKVLSSIRSKSAVALWMLMLASTATASAVSATAQALQKVMKKFETPVGNLSTALKKLEHDAHVNFAYDEAVLQKVQVKAQVFQNASVASILQELLGKSSLQFQERFNTVLIFDASQPARSLSAIQEEKIKVTGTVAYKDGPLAGATVMVKGTTTGVTTDSKGNFSINTTTSPNLTLVVSMIGYGTKEITVGNERTFNITMEETTIGLNQLVVVGYGSQRKALISGAIAEVPLDKLNSRSLNNVQDALQGKVPGVMVQNQGGDPNSPAKVYIRGIGGINGESVLYVVDGMIYKGGPINPNDIESISVLKDASAAIYGAQASGGVILITTKKGKAGSMSINVDVKNGWQSVAKKMDVLSAKQFADVENAAYDAAGIPRSEAFDGTKYPGGQLTLTDWQDEIFRTAKVQDYNVEVKGGSDKSHYFMSFGYRKQDGIILNTYNERYGFRLNSDVQMKPWLKIGENLSFTFQQGNGANTTSPYSGVIYTALGYPRNVKPYNADGTFAGMPIDYAGSYGDLANPVAYLKRLDNRNPYFNISVNPYAEIRFTKDLKFLSSVAVTKGMTSNKVFTTAVPEIGKINKNNNLYQMMSNHTDILSEQTLTYNHLFNGVHNITAVAGYSFQKNESEYLSAEGTNFNDERFIYRYLGNAGAFTKPQSGKDKRALESYIARVNYEYKSKYLLGLLGRIDGTSLVPSQNRYEKYYAVTGGWILTQENFIRENLTFLDFAKIRGSYGLLGNLGSLPSNAYNANLSASNIYMGKEGSLNQGYAENTISNPNLKWAQAKQSDVGMDLGFLNNRLSVTVDYFSKNIDRMILAVDLPSTSGVSNQMYQNVGEVRDRGWEFGVTYRSNDRSEFKWDIGASASTLKNELLSLGDRTSINTSNINVRSSLTPIRIQTGQSLYNFWVVESAGLFQTEKEIADYKASNGKQIQPAAKPGDRKFVDRNDDGVIDDNDKYFAGTPFPKLNYGISFNASYKGFDLNVFAQGVSGNKLFNALKYTNMNPSIGTNYNMLTGILDAWTPTHTNTDVPRLNSKDTNGNYGTVSDWYLENGAYLRLKNVTLGYTLPNNILKQAGLNTVRFYVTGSNLFTITKYKGFDPEVGTDEVGIDKARYPLARTIMVGLNVNF
ncbi:TonB-linked SusC/RagA family outer membrane protein [Chitinophaga skermanii]|uniref:TonB-linked SusC/RagA family outer membrane protein n=1 Tax=Chitinophaga skermanii TaxID=331697 RepID=A0A327R4E8_9BACT|nr:TonB-dependent receptor [Chitinophaga skermanii]RAJ11085.1 TonB-linked SusC/RagA family outer membrane protein [Chitinophaga skermanii]